MMSGIGLRLRGMISVLVLEGCGRVWRREVGAVGQKPWGRVRMYVVSFTVHISTCCGRNSIMRVIFAFPFSEMDFLKGVRLP